MACAALVLVACSGGSGDEARTLRVLAAASLTDAFETLAADFEGDHPDVTVELSPGPSSSLAAQVVEGAPADVLATADEDTMAVVVDAGAAGGEPTVFARNVGQLAVPAGNPAAVQGIADLADGDLLVGLCAEEVPCGKVARALLELNGVDAEVDTNEPDVRALLTKLAAGELDAGIVYRTDVRAAGGEVEGIDIPHAEEAEAVYPVAVLADAGEPALARAFADLVVSDEGRAVLDRLGFLAP